MKTTMIDNIDLLPHFVAVVSLLAAFIVLLVKKWRIAEWFQVHGEKFSSQLFSCDLCMSFWASMAVCLLLLLICDYDGLLILPALTTPITRMLV